AVDRAARGARAARRDAGARPDYPARLHRHDRVVELDPLLRSVWDNPPLLTQDSFPWNTRAMHAAELPAGNAIASARGMAGLYAGLERLLSPAMLRLARTPLAQGRDEANEEDAAYGVGFTLQNAIGTFGPDPEAFGHGGAGGSVHGLWPGHGIGFSYVMNRLRDDQPVDPR